MEGCNRVKKNVLANIFVLFQKAEKNYNRSKFTQCKKLIQIVKHPDLEKKSTSDLKTLKFEAKPPSLSFKNEAKTSISR